MMEDGEYGSKKLSVTVGGCAMNTSRAANKYLQAMYGEDFSKVYTLGCIGKDVAGETVLKQIKADNLMHDIFIDESTLTGACAVTVVNVDRTNIAILDACEKYPLSHL
jgi:sugar/nucleoside kinase (ribokinase family)